MTVYDFCTTRHLQTQRVLKYIKRNPDLFDGHAVKVGKQTELDEVALRLLDEAYPLPPELLVVPNEELQKQLAATKDLVILLQQEAIQREKELAKAQLDARMLEEKTVQLLEARAAQTDLQEQNNSLNQTIGELRAQLAAAEQEADRLRNRSLLQRLLNK